MLLSCWYPGKESTGPCLQLAEAEEGTGEKEDTQQAHESKGYSKQERE